MPVKHGMLALLAEGSSHGYQLKLDFEERTGGTWQLNIGQVYTTLQRLERDGLVESDGPDETDAERRTVRITTAGQQALEGWYATPVGHAPPPRDELVIKVLLAASSPGSRIDEVIRRQRTATIGYLQALTRRKRDADPARDLGLLLHLDALILKAEAEVRWLDTCESRLRQFPRAAENVAGPAPPTAAGRPPDPGPAPRPDPRPAPQPDPQPDPTTEPDRMLRPDERVGGGTR